MFKKIEDQNNLQNSIDIQIGKRLEALRVSCGMTQDEFSEQLGIPIQHLKQYEKGTKRIHPHLLQSIAKEFFVPVSYFFETLYQSAGDTLSHAEDSKFDIGILLLLLQKPETVKLIRSFSSIKDIKIQEKLVNLITTLADYNHNKNKKINH